MAGTPRSQDFDLPNSLMLKVIHLIETDKRTLPEIHRDTGIHYNWLTNLVKGTHKNPSVNRVQFLYEHLTGKRLPL